MAETAKDRAWRFIRSLKAADSHPYGTTAHQKGQQAEDAVIAAFEAEAERERADLLMGALRFLAAESALVPPAYADDQDGRLAWERMELKERAADRVAWALAEAKKEADDGDAE